MEEWQAKRSYAGGAPRLTTGFLDGTHPIVDAYELKVGLELALRPMHSQCCPYWSTMIAAASNRLQRMKFMSMR